MLEPDSTVPLCPLEPPGPVGLIGAASRLAALRGTLVGELRGACVATYIETEPGTRVPLMWPGEYRARLDPLGILDERGEVVASANESVQLGGGHLRPSDPRLAGHRSVFFASKARVMNETDRAREQQAGSDA
jgi:hypothetical protein